MKKGKKVKVINPHSAYAGEVGEVIASFAHGPFPVEVKIDDETIYFTIYELEKVK